MRVIRHRTSGFGLLEVLVTLGVVALVVVLSYPGYKRSGLMAKAQTVKVDLTQIEVAVKMAASELKAPDGVWLNFAQYSKFLPNGSALRKTGLDPFGNPYGPQLTGRKPLVPSKIEATLHGLVPDDFWGGFVHAGEL